MTPGVTFQHLNVGFFLNLSLQGTFSGYAHSAPLSRYIWGADFSLDILDENAPRTTQVNPKSGRKKTQGSDPGTRMRNNRGGC